MNIESDENVDLALDPNDAEGIVGGSGKKKVTAKHHVVHHAAETTQMIVKPALGPTDNAGVEADVPVDPDTGY